MLLFVVDCSGAKTLGPQAWRLGLGFGVVVFTREGVQMCFLGSEINSEVHAKEAISARMCWGRAEAAGVNVSQASKA